jgi:2-dehydropantoate 2-reductase
MRYLILGAGALGGLFGGKLLKGGADVTFLVRPGRAAQLTRDGLVVKAQDGEIRTPVKTLQQGELNGTYDVILVCCKAYDLDGAMEAIAPAVGKDSAIVPLLNGVRHIDTLSKRFGLQHVVGGLTAINAALLPDGVIQQSQLRVSMNILGELDGRLTPRCGAIQAALAKGGIQADVSANIMAGLWAKFFAFTTIAAIASLTRSRAGAIARSADGVAFVSAVLDECARIASAEGFPPPPGTPDVVRGMFSQPDSTYGPSILIDMEDGRPTEGKHTIGDMAERATRLGIAAPILAAAVCNLQAYEINRQQTRR